MRDAANEVEAIPTVPTDVLPRNTKSSLSMATSDSARIAELEFENARLQRLVAELVLKNQKLRDCD
jgi:hypothetical protein